MKSIKTITGDSLDDVSFSKFQYHSLTQTIFEMTQFKMSCGTYDPLRLISRLNTDQGFISLFDAR